MNKDNNLFLFLIILSFFLFPIAFFCGDGDIVICFKFLKVLFFVIILAFSFWFCSFVYCKLFEKEEYKSWVSFNNENYLIPKNAESIVFIFGENLKSIKNDKLRDLAFLKKVDFHGDVKIEKNAFSGCKNLEEVTFFSIPKNQSEINIDAFLGCSSLKKIYLIGDREDWKNFNIQVPKCCEIEFFENKQTNFTETDEKVFKTIKVDLSIKSDE